MNESKDKSSLIIKIVAISLVVLAIIGVIVFMVLNKPKPHDDLDLSYAGKYELVEISGVVNTKTGKVITVEDYEYNYIDLREDGTYEIANAFVKENGKVDKTSQEGIWYIDGNKVILESSKMMGLVKTQDSGVISKEDNTITLSSSNKDGSTTKLVLKK